MSSTACVAPWNCGPLILVKVRRIFWAPSTASSLRAFFFWKALAISSICFFVTPAVPPVDLRTASSWATAFCDSIASLTEVAKMPPSATTPAPAPIAATFQRDENFEPRPPACFSIPARTLLAWSWALMMIARLAAIVHRLQLQAAAAGGPLRVRALLGLDFAHHHQVG